MHLGSNVDFTAGITNLAESGPYSPPRRVEARVSVPRFVKNTERLVQLSRKNRPHFLGLIPMVKCDAYGHGAAPLVQALAEKNLRSVIGLGVATLDEALAIRDAGISLPVFVFSDCTPFSEALYRIALEKDFIPILNSLADVQILARVAKKERNSKLKFHLKFNTGMHRLGIPANDSREVARVLWSARLRPNGVCTHLAQASDLDSKISQTQWARFRSVLNTFADVAMIHAESSDAIFSAAKGPWRTVCNVTRPGIGLYGYSASSKTSVSGIEPVMTVRARVITAEVLGKGESIGYGATFRATKKIARSVLAMGYGDGFRRILSNRSVVIDGKIRRVLGRVSMDVTSVEGNFRPGTWVTLLGGSARSAHYMAEQAETNVYELFTALSPRVRRTLRGVK